MRNRLMIAASSLALAIATSAAAQEAESNTTLGEVVVTAQKRSENLQRVPVAISAYSADQREKLGIVDINDLSNFTPGVQWEFPSPNRITVRGIGRQTGALGTDPGVAAYYDGFYVGDPGSAAGSASSSIGAPQTVERVEVLRGPQGTLYGRNSIGGAVNSVSMRPSHQLGGSIEGTLATNQVAETFGMVRGPINDRLRFLASAGYDYRGEGFIKNVGGPEVETRKSWNGQVQLEADLTDNVQAWVKYGFAGFNWSGIPTTRIDPYDTTSIQGGLQPNPTYGYTTPNPGVADPRKVSLNYDGYLKLRGNHQVVGHLDWDLGSAKLKYIGGYQRYTTVVGLDGDASNRGAFRLTAGAACSVRVGGCIVSPDRVTYVFEHHEQFSHELNLSSNDDGRWRWLLGLYQFGETVDQTLQLLSPNQPEVTALKPDGEYFGLRANLRTRSYAVYGQTDYDLSDQWTVQFGLRYTVDDKRGRESLNLLFFDPNVLPFALDISPGSATSDHKWGGSTARLAVQWKPTAETMGYASVSSGYKSGGFNLGALSPSFIGAERVTTYEAGLKTTLNGVLRLNGAVFYNDYSGLQVPVNLCVDNPATPATPPNECAANISTLVNAEKSRTYGLELESVWAPTSRFQLLANYAFLDAEFRKFCCVFNPADPAAGGQDLAGDPLPFSPRHKVALNASYRFDVAGGGLVVAASASWVAKQYASIFSTDVYRLSSRQTVDLRATWESGDGDWQVIGFVDNLFDDEFNTGVTLATPGTDNARQWNLGPPRQVGLKVKRSF